jgi:uncharacterized protein (DUF1778 family)
MIERKRRRDKEKKLAAGLHARRHESSEWNDKPVGAEVQPNRAVVTSLRLPAAEFVAIQRAAQTAGQTVSDFIRSAIAARLRGNLPVNAVRVVAGSSEANSHTTVLLSVLESGSTQNPGPERMEAIPLYANLLV